MILHKHEWNIVKKNSWSNVISNNLQTIETPCTNCQKMCHGNEKSAKGWQLSPPAPLSVKTGGNHLNLQIKKTRQEFPRFSAGVAVIVATLFVQKLAMLSRREGERKSFSNNNLGKNVPTVAWWITIFISLISCRRGFFVVLLHFGKKYFIGMNFFVLIFQTRQLKHSIYGSFCVYSVKKRFNDKKNAIIKMKANTKHWKNLSLRGLNKQPICKSLFVRVICPPSSNNNQLSGLLFGVCGKNECYFFCCTNNWNKKCIANHGVFFWAALRRK